MLGPRALFLSIALFWSSAWALSPTSYRQPHPLNWIHAVPVGEMPGWTGSAWFFFEISHANIWNAPLKMTDRKTGDTYEYKADFEQITAIAEFGLALSERWAFSLEVPHAYRSGGTMDSFIDGFHQTLGNRRFNRPFYPEDRYTYSVKTNSQDAYDEGNALHGISNVKAKLKYWLYKWEGMTKGSCACGVAISTQVKAPVQDKKYGGTNEKVEGSGLLHFGIPLGRASAIWTTAAYTRLGRNPAMPGWPLLKNHFMYELSMDIAFSQNWGFLLTARTHSPFIDEDRVEFVDSETVGPSKGERRASSGWNSLVRWQGAESIGFRYRPSGTFQISFQAIEDWGLGPYDASDQIYSNGAPDFNYVVQTSVAW